MTNFHGLNPWLNMLNNLYSVGKNTPTPPNNMQPQSVVNNQNAQNNSQLIQSLSTNVFSKIPTDFLTNETQQAMQKEVLKMDNEVVQKYLQNLLEMPEDLDKFLNIAKSKNIENKSFQFLKVFVEHMLNNKELSQLLKQNSNDAIQKLLNVITQSLKTGSDVSQLKEILSVLNVIHTTSSANTNTLRELFLLYIPINYQVFKDDTDFSQIIEDNEEGIKESTLSILFETRNFSNILATLNDADKIVTIEIHASDIFPYEAFKQIITSITKDSPIRIACDFLKIKESTQNGSKQNFKIISDNFVSIDVLNISQMVIKTIFKLDCEMQEN